jgi:hypothetical protein
MKLQNRLRTVGVTAVLVGYWFGISSGMAQLAQPGRTATVPSGLVGQRQTDHDTAPNVAASGRINNRVQNRVESRIRSRIDKSYVAQADATSSIVVSSNRARLAGRAP